MFRMSPLAGALAVLAVFLFTVLAVSFTADVLAVGSCGVGPAAPSGVTCQEAGR